MKKILIAIIIILLIALFGGGLYYWYFYNVRPASNIDTDNPNTPSGFTPINNNTPVTITKTDTPINEATSTEIVKISDGVYKPPKLRQLSQTPIATLAASSTATSSIVRFVDRGTGHIYQASNISSEIIKISNTTLPKIYDGYPNKNGSAFIIRYLKDESDIINNFYTELRPTGTSTTETPYEIKGKYLSPDINQVAISPNGDKAFTFNIENNRGTGYISSFDEKIKTKIIDTPLTQVMIDWPETNTVTFSTKASGVSSGFMYSVDIKTGIIKSIIGGIKGLTTKMNHDLSKVIYSVTVGNDFITSIFSTKDNTVQETIFKTLPDKCVWSNLKKDEIYCAVPTEIPNAIYPDDWYKGAVSFIDQIWYLNTTTGEVHLVANLLKLSNQLIDATRLTLDPKENTLYFINKRDLNLWALDLNQ